MCRQLFARPRSRGDSNGSCAESFAAGDVVPGVADYIDLSGVEIVAVFLLSTRAGELTELITIVMVVRKGAEFEKIPETVVL